MEVAQQLTGGLVLNGPMEQLHLSQFRVVILLGFIPMMVEPLGLAFCWARTSNEYF